MIRAWSTDAVYDAEAALMATLPDGELMARAVEGLALVAAARLQECDGAAVAALVGPGNNGADALYAVARLAEAGWNAVAVHDEVVHDGARAAAEAAGVLLTTDPAALAEADVVLDGILGIGARPGLPPWAAAWVAAVPDTAYVIAVDLPSGQDPMGGALDPDGVFADETVTFSVPKPVHLLPPTEQACGILTVVDIGLDLAADPVVLRLDHDDVAALWPVPTPADDKYSRGVVGVVAGGEAYTGAAVLAVTAAVESGAGMVRYVGTPTPTALVRAAVPEAVHGPGRVQAWVVGPGLDVEATDDDAAAQLEVARAALAGGEPVVLDAGGLDLVDADLVRSRAGRATLLTPHAGECARLLSRLSAVVPGVTYWSISGQGDVTRAQVEASPVAHAKALAAATGATVLLKGPTTVVVGPAEGAPVWSQADAPAWLGSAGAGDVLAGVLGTLLAAGLPPDSAGALGALVHGVAADRANPGGPVRALRVANGIPDAVAHLLGRAATRSS
ncbi:bifunctional ADP-dependent NAD(P)H-hydrate dehydratase/NAD(P)H-hydrate epimerase [Ornithinibacter aureus]|uniref:ADP-dependent (S)-NAD(P)H-hydrate dehydratase n=1 Tax=Ornithinibacter aureus TaxID=622664 RepID=A0ABP8JLZ8_9MICO|nr:bifunctional ADP-dependent NAD(P)H-hydrate dehydratase/NAD(P)H-hydrate epimerase [Ornithinibacter aureus]KAF0835171.1 NAD(P)H-hydrate repair Nnr-like enzyme with NAD(P)H-hydrate dehydratase domain [Ornithinibacter aureus]